LEIGCVRPGSGLALPRLCGNLALRELWERSGITQADALALLNRGQVRPLKMSTFKAYMAGPDTVRRRECPVEMLAHAKNMLEKIKS